MRRAARRPVGRPRAASRRPDLGPDLGPGIRPGVGSELGERGSATVEAAFAVCAVIAVLALGLGAAASVFAQLRCADAAREAARLVARGEPGRAQEVARRVAPDGASVAVRIDGDEVTVEVRARPALPGVEVDAVAIAVLEPGVVT